jgi:hypothetical protein
VVSPAIVTMTLERPRATEVLPDRLNVAMPATCSGMPLGRFRPRAARCLAVDGDGRPASAA